MSSTLYNQIFNPQFVDPNYYSQASQQNRYECEQNIEIAKAVKALHDLCEALKRIDPAHQEAASYACWTEMMNQLGFDNNGGVR